MNTKQKHVSVGNKALSAAFIELRKGSRTSPQESRYKRLRTKERVLHSELRTY